jgi:hypothetical protein
VNVVGGAEVGCSSSLVGSVRLMKIIYLQKNKRNLRNYVVRYLYGKIWLFSRCSDLR